MSLKTALTLSLLVLTPTIANAHSPDTRQTYQLGEIERGRQSGAITWTEGLKLRKQQREIANVQKSLEADGRLSKRDRRVLDQLQTDAEKNIADKATNLRHRATFLPRVGR